MPKYLQMCGRGLRDPRRKTRALVIVEFLDARVLLSALAPEDPPEAPPPCVAELLPPPSATLFYD